MRIIDSYPPNWTFVVAVGHDGNLVQDVLEVTYAPDLLSKINIVTTDSYRTPGKGLSHTLLDAQRALPDSFVFHACDSLLFPAGANCTRLLSDTDQVFMAKTVHAGIYRTLTQEAGRHVRPHEGQPKESEDSVGL